MAPHPLGSPEKFKNLPTIIPNINSCADFSQLARLFVQVYFDIWES